MAKYTVKFKVNCDDYLIADHAEFFKGLEFDLKDLLTSSILPALNLDLVPLTFEVRKARS